MTPTTAAIVVGLVLAAIYPVSCWIWPFRRCWVCDGRGRHSPEGNRRIFRMCRWCRGTGRRLRIGRRIWNWWAAARRDGR